MRVLVVIFALICTAAAQSVPAPTIAVVDENGVAVSSARVTLQSTQTPAVHCQTDFTGRCPFPTIAPGQYQLRVEKEGYYAVDEPIVQITQASILEVAISHQQEVRETVDVHESPVAIDPAQVSSRNRSAASTSSTSFIPAPTTIATS